MKRCLELATLGLGSVASNPLVGACLVYNQRIIGEGWHQKFGGPHAEVEAIRSVPSNDEQFIAQSTLYVNLEPCSHFGKTPPCANLIVEKGIKKVVVGMQDPNPLVAGKGIKYLKDHGVEVISDVLNEACLKVNRRFLCFITKQRPYIILKWAETADGYLAKLDRQQAQISGDVAKSLLHKWRSEEMSIAVGSGTIKADQPALNNRLWPGASPVKIAFDRNLTQLDFYTKNKFIVFNDIKSESLENGSELVKLNYLNNINSCLTYLFEKKIQSILIEGGQFILNHFIENQCYDEVRIFKSKSVNFANGIAAPSWPNLNYKKTDLKTDLLYLSERTNL